MENNDIDSDFIITNDTDNTANVILSDASINVSKEVVPTIIIIL